jgi:hypothetical protein
MSEGVRQISVPAPAKALCGLPRIDYADAFLLDCDTDLTGEEWARAVLGDAPAAIRARLLTGWATLGLLPSVRAPRGSLLGWEIRSSTADFAVLSRRSVIGMPGELLFMRSGGGLLFATFVAHRTRVAAMVWSAAEAGHVAFVRTLLADAGRRLTASGRVSASAPDRRAR